MNLAQLSLSLSTPRGGSAAGVSLSPSSILEKTGALGLVGTLSGVTGTPILSDSAGGKFLLMGGTIRCGGVETNYGTASSHSITVTDDNGPHVLTVTVSQAASTASPSGGSISFQRRNGAAGTRVFTGPALTNFMGNGTVAANGFMMIRVSLPAGNLTLDGQSSDFSAFPWVFGTIPSGNPRGVQVRYYAKDKGSSQAYVGRYVISGWDQGGNGLGNWAANDAPGAPTGITTSNGLRSAVIKDSEPRLLVLTYEAATTTFSVFTVKMDGTIEAGDTLVNTAWKGITTSTNPMVIGSVTTPGGPNNSTHFSGSLSDLAIGVSLPTSTNLQNIAKGRDITTELGSANIQRRWTLDDTSGSGLTSTGTQSAQAFTATTTGSRSARRGPMLTGAFDGTDGIAIIPRGDGFTAGLAYTAATGVTAASQPLSVKVLVNGAACNVEARVRRQADGAVMADWHQIGTSISGRSTLSTAAIPAGKDYAVDVRRADKPTLIASDNNRYWVGVKVWHEGQSQVARWARTGVATLSAASSPSVSFSNQRGGPTYISEVDIGVCDNGIDWSDGPMALAERLNTLAPNLVVHFCIAGISSTSISDWITNKSSGYAYPIWGDYTTAGSGVVTDTMLAAGVDLTFMSSHRGTSDNSVPADYTDWLRAEYLGTGPKASTKSYAGFTGLPAPHVLMWPLARDVDPANNPYAAGWNSHHATFNSMRVNQAQWSPPAGVTMTLCNWFADMMMDSSTEGPHEKAGNVRGYQTEGYRMALGVLRQIGLLTYTIPTVSGVVRTSGTVLTVSFTLPNGGSLKPRVAGVAPNGIFEVSEDSGTTWRGQEPTPPFTAAYSGNTVTLTKGGGWAAAGSLRVRFAYGGPYSYGVTTSRATQYANENVDIDGYPFESFTAAAPSDGSGYIQGLPIQPTLANLTVT